MNFLIIIIVKDFCMIPNSWEKLTEIRIWLSIRPKNKGVKMHGLPLVDWSHWLGFNWDWLIGLPLSVAIRCLTSFL
jgi:hypothetical protein